MRIKHITQAEVDQFEALCEENGATELEDYKAAIRALLKQVDVMGDKPYDKDFRQLILSSN